MRAQITNKFSTLYDASMVALVLLTASGTVALIRAEGLTVVDADFLQPAVVCAALLAAAVYYHRRQVPGFVLCLKALLVLVTFSTAFCLLTYAVAATARPMADELLARLDAACGFSASKVVEWCSARSWLFDLLWVSYFSVIPQTVLAIVYLGLRNERWTLDRFLLRFMVCAMLTTVGFYFLPAYGTCTQFHFAVPSHYQPIIEHLDAVRSGTRTLLTLHDAEGLITFPSFHAVWGVLLILAFWPDRYLRWPMFALNGLMIASTIPIGMHYLTDVLVGTAISGLVVAAEYAALWLLSKRAANGIAWSTARRATA